jgi:hypothetical protein
VRNAMAAATSYNILVSVVNPDPAAIKIDYDLVKGTERYLKPFITELGSLADVTYQTQVIRYVKLPHKPVKNNDVYYLSEVSRGLSTHVVMFGKIHADADKNIRYTSNLNDFLTIYFLILIFCRHINT